MGPEEFYRHLEQAAPAPVYLFKGEADSRLQEAWELLVAKIVPAEARRFNGERLSAKDHAAPQVLARLSILPMFGSKQLLMVQNIEVWSKDQRKLLLGYLQRPHSSACLVLTLSPQKASQPLESAVAKVGKVVHFAPPTAREAPHWLQQRAKRLNKHLSPQTALVLLEQVGLDLSQLERELEKLAAYTGDRKEIRLQDIRTAGSTQRSYSVFELLRLVSRQQTTEALVALRKLLLAGEAPLAVLALLARQIRLVWQCKDASQRGMELPELTRRLNLPSFAVKNYLAEAEHFRNADLYAAHQLLQQADLALKSTGTPPEQILEALVLRLCRKNVPSRRD